MTQAPPSISPLRTKACVALLALLGFSLGVSEFVPIGVESELAAHYGVSLSEAGRSISIFALFYAIMTPTLALSTGRFKRYHLLVVYSGIFILGNALSSIAASFGAFLVARVVMGSISGALLAVCVTYIPELCDFKRVPLVISIVYGAFSVALVLATSIGKLFAATIGWHAMADSALVLSVATCAALVAIMPKTGNTDAPATFREQVGLLGEPCVISGMFIFVFSVGSVYVFYAYVTPYLQQVLGLDDALTSTLLMAYGIICVASNALSGWIDSRIGMKGVVGVNLALALSLAAMWLAGNSIAALAAIAFVGLFMYASSISCISLFMAVSRNRHPKALTLASSLEPLAFNIGITFGTSVGGAVVAGPGIANVGIVGAAFAIVAAGTTLLTMKLAKRKP